ncbi:response regulator transcription factor [Microcoleus sp. FACHB-672]|uniref:response regulator transcription factor n=1 Tax=Microcoleus sp. FACHB-672 TaxID=2692825 RepID=UPI00168A12DA|nr:response regulator transcription factor [Microcoleus sp. FACHB-672]MBD2041291.1 response regulator transcription factor [Microcoleus sp. FACHB-672]
MPLTILVVDDDPGTRLAISHYLEMSGYSVITAENGQEALKMVDEYQPHLMVTDIIMPRMDGYQLVRQVRQRPAFRLLPVIFLTARTNTEERIRGYQLGCDIYLPKPFELDELGAVIRNLLERSQLIQSEWRFSYPDTLRSPNGSVLPSHLPQAEASEAKPIPATDSEPVLPLTQREQEVLDLLTVGLSNVQIGECLHLSPRTVEKYVSSLLRKTSTSNRAELVRFAMEHHLVK